jgi:hypothetical protein
MAQAEGRIYLDGVCYRGPRRRFDPAVLGEVVIVAGLELLRADQPPAVLGPAVREADSAIFEAVWPVAGGLEVMTPARGRPYQ